MALDGREHKPSPLNPDSVGYGSETLLLLSVYNASFVPCGTVRFHTRVLTLFSPSEHSISMSIVPNAVPFCAIEY